jgi:iron complex transport system permease protein
MMIVTGQVVGAVAGVFTTLVTYYYATTDPYGDAAQFLQEVAVATFIRDFTWIDLVAIGVPLLATFLVVMRLRQKMMLLALDKTEQRTMGVNTRRMNVAVVMLCTLLTAIIISFCGTVGFVGFLVPHLARRLVGPNFKYLLPASTVLGAVFVLGAYALLEATLGVDYAQMVGMFISIGGAAVFLVTALRGKGAGFGAFK